MPGVAAEGILATEKGWMVSANWGKIAGWWPAQSPSSPVDDPLPGGKKGVYFAYTFPGFFVILSLRLGRSSLSKFPELVQIPCSQPHAEALQCRFRQLLVLLFNSGKAI